MSVKKQPDDPVPPASPTMEDVARAMGLHRTTISLALRNHPRIPEATRARVRQMAQQMGYRPHPMVSALMSYRANHRKPTWRGTLGLITTGQQPQEWRKPPAYAKMFDGAKKRAYALGYDLQPFWVGEGDFSVRRFNTMLRTRNVPGVIVAPAPLGTVLPPLDWSQLSAVAIGYSVREPDFNRIAHDYYHSMVLAIACCRERGLRRIGLVLDFASDARVNHLWLSAYLMQQKLDAELAGLEPLIVRPKGGDVLKLAQWLQTQRPEVILSLPGGALKREMGLLPPRQRVPIISLGCYEREGRQSGIFQNYEWIGACAVDFLTAMVNRGERGIPEQSQTLAIKGLWVDGEENDAG